MWIKLMLATLGAAMIGAMVLLYNHTMKKNGELEKQLETANASIVGLQNAAAESAARYSALAEIIQSHTEAIAKTSADLAKKQTHVTRVYRESDDATRSILDSDLPQFRCLYEAGGCEAPAGVRN